MNLADLIVIGVCVLILGAAIAYIIISKRKRGGCIGCPYSGSCQGCSCSSENRKNKK